MRGFCHKKAESYPTATIWPSGDVTVGFQQPYNGYRKLSEIEEWFTLAEMKHQARTTPNPDRARTLEELMASIETVEETNPGLAERLMAVFVAQSEVLKHDPELADIRGLSVTTNSHTRISTARPRRGLKGISAFGKKMIRSICTVKEEQYGKNVFRFVTITLPHCSDLELERICAGWSEILRQFIQQMRRTLADLGLPDDIWGVTEIQPKRFKRTGQPVPHYHFVVHGRHKPLGWWLLSRERIEEIWQAILNPYFDRPVDWSSAQRTEKIEHSLACELGKYMSKAGQPIAQVKEMGLAHLLPTGWWNANLRLKRQIKSMVVKLPPEQAEALATNVENLKRFQLMNMRALAVEFEVMTAGGKQKRQRLLGYGGYFTSQESLKHFMLHRDVFRLISDLGQDRYAKKRCDRQLELVA